MAAEGNINRKNPILWYGDFDALAFSNVAKDDSAFIAYIADSIHIDVLANDTSTLGINYDSVEIVESDPTNLAPVYDKVAKKIIFNKPITVLGGSVKSFKYRWRDIAGNLSNVATVRVEVEQRPFSYRPYAPSLSCIKVDNKNTGYAEYAKLEKYWTDTNTRAIPYDIVDNVIAHPNYVAPFRDLSACPLPGQSAELHFYSLVHHSIITGISFSGGNPIGLEVRGDNPNQPVIIQIKPGFYEKVTIHFTHAILEYGAEMWIKTSTNEVGKYLNTLVINGSLTFDNITFDEDFAGTVTFKR